MIEKKDGIINAIVYKHTIYNDGNYRYYPTIVDLETIMKDIIESGKTTKYIQVIPFYINAKRNFQEEFDMADFYVGCRDVLTEEEQQNFARKQMFWLEPDSEYKLLERYITLEDMQRSHFLVESSDVIGFQQAIQSYIDFLMDRGIPQMMQWLHDTRRLKTEDLPYGYFCFGVFSD